MRVVRKPQKPLTDSEVRALKPGSKRQVQTLGNSLFMVVEAVAKGGSKRFVGKYRYPPGRSGKQKEYSLGSYGKGAGKLTLKQARDEWEKVRAWASETGKDPIERKQAAKQQRLALASSPPLKKVFEDYLAAAKLKTSTRSDYANKLFNQVLPELGPDTPIERLSWSNGGRDAVLRLKRGIERRAPSQSDKVLTVMRQAFDFAIDQGWLEEPNPARNSKYAKSEHIPGHNPSLPWDQLPLFFERLERNEANGSLVVRLGLKVVVMTFLRVGSLVPARWEELDYEKGQWVIPSQRMKRKLLQQPEDHLVPLTPQLVDVFRQLQELNGHQEFVFFSGRGGATPHIHPQSLNQHLVKMGYRGMTTAHGFRALALTAGIDQLGYSNEIIQRQLAHDIGDKVRKAYDRSLEWEKRVAFMTAWCDAMVDQGLVI